MKKEGKKETDGHNNRLSGRDKSVLSITLGTWMTLGLIWLLVAVLAPSEVVSDRLISAAAATFAFGLIFSFLKKNVTRKRQAMVFLAIIVVTSLFGAVSYFLSDTYAQLMLDDANVGIGK